MAWGRRTTSAQTPAWSQDDYHAAFAGTLKDQIEQGVAPWQKPWKPGERRLPENIQTGRPYRGGNAVYLSVTQTAKGYRDHRWATYKQIKDLGGQVRKGEKATDVLFDKCDDEREKQQRGAAEKERTRPPMVRCYAVFNVAQADGLQLERQGDDREHEPEWKAHQTAERVIQESGIHVVHARGDRAFDNMQTDRVTLPEREQFATANGSDQTAVHELGHATGHPARMDRDTLTNGVGNFGSVEYAREERRAELSAMLTGARVGVGHDGSRGATYVQGWRTALEHDPQEIDQAAAEAQHMSDSLRRQIREHEQAIAQKHAALAERYSAARRPQISAAPLARPLDPRPPLPAGAGGGPRAGDRQPEGDPPPRRARRSGAGARGTRPGPRPPVPDRARQLAALAALGWTGRAAEWIALVCLHSGVFIRSQWRYFVDDPHREPVRRFVRPLLDRGAGVEDERAIFPGRGRAVHITHKAIYRALGIPDVRRRRGQAATTQVLMRRLLSLDDRIERPSRDLLVESFKHVGRLQMLVVLARQAVEVQRLADVRFDPIGELRIAGGPAREPRLQILLGLLEGAAVVEPAQRRCVD